MKSSIDGREVNKVEQTDSAGKDATELLASSVRNISVPHARIHDGLGFHVTHKAAAVAGSGGTFDILLKNPTTSNEPHFRYIIQSTGSPADIVLYKDTAVSADGTTIPVFNVKMSSANTSNMTVFHTPTVTDVGTIFETNFIPTAGVGAAAAGGTGSSPIEEWILDDEKNYLIRITNNHSQAQDFHFSFFWYEPPS